jgi:hypothetical protein
MDSALRAMLWDQFGAAIDTLDNALRLCPDELWTVTVWKDPDDARYGQFWFVAYHTVFWLDLYLAGYSEGFKPPPPFVRGKLPDTPYTNAQLRGYLQDCRQKCQATILSLTDEQASQRCTFGWIEASYLEMQLYCMRHVQEHAAHLNLVLGHHGVEGQDWVSKARQTVS